MEARKQKFIEDYKEYEHAIFTYCSFRIADKEKAKDFTSETFSRMWEYLVSGNEIHNVKTFLYTTAHHIIIDEYRKKKALSLEVLVEQGGDMASTPFEYDIYAPFEFSRMKELMKNLPETFSSVLLMRYVDDLSVKDIAHITHESENVISVRLHRGIGKLRKLAFGTVKKQGVTSS